MRPIDLQTNVLQAGEVARIRELALRGDDQARQALAREALLQQRRRRESVERPPSSREARVQREGRGPAGGGGNAAHGQTGGRSGAPPDEDGAGGEPAPSGSEDATEKTKRKGRFLDLRA